jgi:nucleotide-binding universal stress UspA family protein
VAARGGGRLVVLFVNDPLLVSAAAAANQWVSLRDQTWKQLDHFVHTTLGPAASMDLDRRVATGATADQILALVRDVRADLIVVGSNGRTGMARLTLGSTAAAVLKRAPVPVLVIPADDSATPRGMTSWPRGRLVASVMLDRTTGAAVDAASCVAEWFGCSLLLLHVLINPGARAWLRGRAADHHTDQLERTRRRLGEIAASATRGPTRGCVLEGHSVDAIAAAAKRQRTPLLITTLRDRRRLFDPGRGSLTYRIFTRGGVPVLACPPRWRPR